MLAALRCCVGGQRSPRVPTCPAVPARRGSLSANNRQPLSMKANENESSATCMYEGLWSAAACTEYSLGVSAGLGQRVGSPGQLHTGLQRQPGAARCWRCTTISCRRSTREAGGGDQNYRRRVRALSQPFFLMGPPRFASRTFAVRASTIRSVTRPFLSITFRK